MTDKTQTDATSQEEEADETQVVTTETTVDNKDDSTKVTQEVTKEEEVKTEEPPVKDEDSDEDDEFGATIKKARNEAKNLRTRLRQAEQEIVELKANTDSELAKQVEDYKQKYDALFKEHRTEKVTRLAVEAARKNGAIEPDAVAKLIDQSKVEWSDAGEPTNVADVVVNLKGTYKGLFTKVGGSGNGGNRNERGAELNDKATPAQLIANAYKKTDDD